MFEIYYSRTPGCRAAKKLIGYTNQFLLTGKLGLLELEANGPTQVEHLPGSWNPRSIESSIGRTDMFLRAASLVWIVDSVDAYARSLAEKHPELFDEETLEIIRDKGVWVKIERLSELHDVKGKPICSSMLLLGVAWRNRLVHSGPSKNLPQGVRGQLKNMSEFDREWYRSLDPEEMVEQFKSGKYPRFKEVASIVQSAVSWVIDLDAMIVSKVDIEEYAMAIVYQYLSKSHQRSNFVLATEKKKENIIENLLVTAGFTQKSNQSMSTGKTLKSSLFSEVYTLSNDQIQELIASNAH